MHHLSYKKSKWDLWCDWILLCFFSVLEKLMTSRDDALSIFDVCSLALYGTHALPIRLKIVIVSYISAPIYKTC